VDSWDISFASGVQCGARHRGSRAWFLKKSVTDTRSNRTDEDVKDTGNILKRVVDNTSDLRNRLNKVTDTSGNTQWVYNQFGEITSKTQTIGTVALTVSYGYDPQGRMTSMTLPSGKVVTYGFNTYQPASVTVDLTTVLTAATYEPFGPVNGWTWGDATTRTRVFDLRGLETSHSLAADTRTLGYNNVSELITLDDTRHDLDFDYDALGRLFDFDALGLAPLASQDFSYDANGNRQSFTEGSSYAYTVTPNTNRVATVAGPAPKTYLYDAAGNITSDGSTTYTYDDRGRMVTAGTATYTFNGLGQRVKKDNGTVTLFAYDEAGNLIGEYDSLGNPIREHVWFDGAPVAVIVGSDVHYVHTDHLGTPRAITDSGTVIWRWESDPFGSTLAQEDPDGDLTLFTYNLRFPGQYYDSESGLHYNYFRTYDPSTGRYLESDPIGLEGGLNSYGYVDGNPLALTDPYGLEASAAALWLTRGAGAGLCAVPVPGARVLGLSMIAATIAGDTPIQRRDEAGNKVIPLAITLTPPGNCGPGQHRNLQDEVDSSCSQPRSCRNPFLSESAILDRLANGRACGAARDKINKTCFAGGDTDHRNEALRAWKTFARCESKLWPN